jgi:hypothetical protein
MFQIQSEYTHDANSVSLGCNTFVCHQGLLVQLNAVFFCTMKIVLISCVRSFRPGGF